MKMKWEGNRSFRLSLQFKNIQTRGRQAANVIHRCNVLIATDFVFFADYTKEHVRGAIR